jgi:flagellar biosynthesis GTPase FlhF
MKIIRHTARDMRQALRAVREQLGEDAVILSSRRTSEGVEVTAAVDFDASNLEAGGFGDMPAEPTPVIEAKVVSSSRGASAPPRTQMVAVRQSSGSARANGTSAQSNLAPGRGSANAPASQAATSARGAPVASATARAAAATPSATSRATGASPTEARNAAPSATSRATAANAARPQTSSGMSQSALVLTGAFATRPARPEAALAAAAFQQVADETDRELEPDPESVLSYDQLAANQTQTHEQPHDLLDDEIHEQPHRPLRAYGRAPGYDTEWISEAAREAVVEHAAAPRAPVLAPAPGAVNSPAVGSRTELPVFRGDARGARAHAEPAREEPFVSDDQFVTDDEAIALSDDPVTEARKAALAPFGRTEGAPAGSAPQASLAQSAAGSDAMGNELKTLRRMLETQLAHLAWNDLTRRAPVHTEMLRELTEIGITQDLAEHLVRQLPEDTDLTFARRFTIAGLSQYLKVTGDRWFDDGGRIAFAGATGVGKTTTLAKIAVRWVLRHGPRDIALIAGDSVRIGAQDQLKSLAQLLGVPVYTPEKFDDLPSLLASLNERLVLIDTPGSSVRDPQLGSRLAVLANSASKLETVLVLAASTQAGATEEAVKHFAPANPSCCVLTKLDEAASLGGVLSILIRARMPVSYMSEGQRVPEDLRPARALELVSAAVRLAKSRGAAADEDLLRRRFGKNAHGIS